MSIDYRNGSLCIPSPSKDAPLEQWVAYGAVAALAIPLAFGYTDEADDDFRRAARSYLSRYPATPSPSEPTREPGKEEGHG